MPTAAGGPLMSKLNPALCYFEDWQLHLPDEHRDVPLQKWLRRSRDGLFPPYAKALSNYSSPIWSRSAILDYFERHFAQTHPGAVRALRDAGFKRTDSAPDYPVRTTRGPTRRKKKINLPSRLARKESQDV